jgi:hypothetical protein
MRTVALRALWGLLGLATVVTAGVFGTHLIVMAGVTRHNAEVQPTRTFTVHGTVTSVTVRSYGDDVSVTSGDVRQVRVTERLNYDPQDSGAPPLEQTVRHGQLTLGDPACYYGDYNCDVSYAVTVPPGVSATVQSDGGDVSVSGTAGADVDSYGGTVTAIRIAGPLTVTTGGGDLLVRGVTGAFSADTYGGTLDASGVTAASAAVSTSGGEATIAFTAPPDQVLVSTDGGTAALTLPGGPYALTTSDDQGGASVRVPTSPTARRVITVSSGGGPVYVRPPRPR